MKALTRKRFRFLMQMNSWKWSTRSRWIMELSYWKVKIIKVSLGSHCSRTAYKYSALLLKHYQVISILLKFMWKTSVSLEKWYERTWLFWLLVVHVCHVQCRLKKIRVALLESSNIVIKKWAWDRISLSFIPFKYIVINQEIQFNCEMK